MHEAFYGKYNRVFCACANSVYQASPRGEGPGDEVKMQVREQYPGTSIFALVSIMPRPLSEKSRGSGHGTIFALPCKMLVN